MVPAPHPGFRARHRQLLQLLALACMAAGWYLVSQARPGLSRGSRHGHIFGGLALMILGTVVHPGSLGDRQVPLNRQRSLALGMVRDNVIGEDNFAWTFTRVVTQIVATLGAVTLLPNYAVTQRANGYGLITLIYDRAWVDVRHFRAPLLGTHMQVVQAFVRNTLTGNVLDTTAAFINLGIANLLAPHKNEITPPNILLALAPLYAGTAMGQAWNVLVAPHTPAWMDGGAARMPGHILRLIVRHYMRVALWPTAHMRYPVLRFVMDLCSAFTLHRWAAHDAHPSTVLNGLLVAPEVEAQQFLTPPRARATRVGRSPSVSSSAQAAHLHLDAKHGGRALRDFPLEPHAVGEPLSPRRLSFSDAGSVFMETMLETSLSRELREFKQTQELRAMISPRRDSRSFVETQDEAEGLGPPEWRPQPGYPPAQN